MSQQMRYVANKPLGFNNENQVWVGLRGADLIEQLTPLKNELLAEPNILNVVDALQVPGFGNGIIMMPMESNDGVVGPEQVEAIAVGLNYVLGLGIEVTRGRPFSEDRTVDESKSWMVNETLVRKMGWDEPLGKLIGTAGEYQGTVVGVTSDFHYAPLNNEIGPLLIQPFVPNYENTPPQTRPLQRMNLIVNITGENVGETLRTIEGKIRQFDSTQVFDPSFLDVRLNELYRSEQNLMGLTEIFAGVCIFLSAMGLFGLASFNTQQRNKEIGVRKILGASSPQIILLLCKNLIVLIAVAAVPATILSYLTIINWMERFVYRAEPGVFGAALPFFVAILFVSAVALITVITQSLKTARANPIEALRYE
jgi:putative ABC transport system permease protein